MSHHGNNPEKIAEPRQAQHLSRGAVREVPREAEVDARRRRLAARSLADPLRQRHERERSRTRASTSRRCSPAAGGAARRQPSHPGSRRRRRSRTCCCRSPTSSAARSTSSASAPGRSRSRRHAQDHRPVARRSGSLCGSSALSLCRAVVASLRPRQRHALDRRGQGRQPRRRPRAAEPHAPSTRAEADGMTALHWAVRADDLETVQLLIQRRRQRRAPPTATASRRSRSPPPTATPAITRALLKAGADPNALGPTAKPS